MVDIDGNKTSSEEHTWQEIMSKISKIRDDLIVVTESLELNLIEIYEKKTCVGHLTEQAKFKKIVEASIPAHFSKSQNVMFENYRAVSETRKKKNATVHHLLSQIQQEL